MKDALPSIREIIAKYELDTVTDKDTCHSYVEPYEELLKPFRKKKCNLLEIGVFSGGSSLIWHEYLQKSQLFLVDIIDRMKGEIRQKLDPERYSFDIMDAYSIAALNSVQKSCPEGFDIIIDDGPHTAFSQFFVLEHYLPLLRSGGVLVIEDIQEAYHIPFLRAQVTGMSVEVVDLRSQKGRYDDILFVVKR